mgnify:CR=1 FL=1
MPCLKGVGEVVDRSVLHCGVGEVVGVIVRSLGYGAGSAQRDWSEVVVGVSVGC